LRTPTNITGSAWERMPAVNRLLSNYRNALKTPGATAEIAKAKSTLGWGFMATFGYLGYFGIFSGSDVDIKGSFRDKYELQAAGNRQPKSFRFKNFLSKEIQELTGLKGSKLQASLNGFEPAVFLAAMAADVGGIFANIQEDWDGWGNIEDDVKYFLSAYAIAFGENILNTPFMNGTGRLMDFVQNMKMSDDKKGPLLKEGNKLLSNLVPYTKFLSQFEDLGSKEIETEKYGLVNADDFRKLNFEFKSMVQKNIPGFENNLPLQKDWLGDENPKFSVISSMEEHPANIEAIRIGYKPIPLRKKYAHTVWEIKNKNDEVVDLDYGIPVNVKLTEKEYAILEEHQGKLIKEYLTDLLKEEDYINEPNKPYQLEMFKEEIGLAKTDARANFEDPEQNPLWLDIVNRAEDLAVEKWKKTRSNK